MAINKTICKNWRINAKSVNHLLNIPDKSKLPNLKKSPYMGYKNILKAGCCSSVD
ncbi:hypothetical protein [Abyssogena phaseoliformis symbiont]|uniref:hypothetical protein n=1 Tax=Abyssogena phaseoliformis symbiont TaxID=596095 RepID=UPI001CEC4A95|nr:hypothetical protein [Abyssogena phaseoliformis symbiont]MBW5288849.1 hypothetical protein [Candidatus Ruthia sp. Apha_13_S6]